jgi:ABC-type nitrate/sulfonate/bicarbonate transport system ATPase subunit
LNIIIDELTKYYNDKPVLYRVSLEIPSGKINAILGPSGSGKTTLLRLIAQLEKPDSGRITGVSQADTAFMFQEPRLFPWLDAAGNIACVLDNKKSAAYYAAADWLKKVGLSEDGKKYPSELSGGMNRRVALARTLAYNKPLVLLDEPFHGLDAKLKTEIIGLVKKESKGKTVLFITHDLSEAAALADNVIRLDDVNCLAEASSVHP